MIKLWASNHDPYSHRCRIVISEKDLGLDQGIGIVIKAVDLKRKPQELASLNPHNRVPVLDDRDLCLYESNIINEYIDERFPHPQLMPLGVSEKGRSRLLMYEFNSLFALGDAIESKPDRQADAARSELAARLLAISPRLRRSRFLIGNEFSMVDATLAPLLWRLQKLKIKLPLRGAPLAKYAETIFERQAFRKSLTPAETNMRR